MDSDWFNDDEGRKVYKDKCIIASKAAILEELAFGLLRASKTIANEAAVVIYRLNAFHFGGSQVWNPLYGWLDLIGQGNRSYLQRISLELVKLEYLNVNNLGVEFSGGDTTFGAKTSFPAHNRQKMFWTL
jgi:hypothetical protein